jgi:hypothetical protein
VVATLMACDATSVVQPIPNTPATPTPCDVTCPPPLGSPAGSKAVQSSHFSFWYYDPPWTLADHNASRAILTHETDFGNITVELVSSQVASGASADDLLAAWVKQNLDPNKYQGLRERGSIHGAEIGYMPGAGTTYTATLALPNAPAAPVYLQVLAATHGTTGIVFVVLSPLDPSHPDPTDRSQVRSVAYDHIVNSVRWL